MAVLVVEDDLTMREILAYNIQKAGFEVTSSENGSKAISEALERKPKVVILDLMLPEVCGMTVCQTIKKNIPDTTVIILTALCDKTTEIKAKDNGADYFLGKPFSTQELICLIKKCHQKIEAKDIPSKNERIVHDDIIVSPPTLKVRVCGEEIKLSAKEYQLLYFMIKNKDKLLTRDVISRYVWGYDFLRSSRTIDIHVATLRKKIESKSANRFIKTVRGLGYIFESNKRSDNA